MDTDTIDSNLNTNRSIRSISSEKEEEESRNEDSIDKNHMNYTNLIINNNFDSIKEHDVIQSSISNTEITHPSNLPNLELVALKGDRASIDTFLNNLQPKSLISLYKNGFNNIPQSCFQIAFRHENNHHQMSKILAISWYTKVIESLPSTDFIELYYPNWFLMAIFSIYKNSCIYKDPIVTFKYPTFLPCFNDGLPLLQFALNNMGALFDLENNSHAYECFLKASLLKNNIAMKNLALYYGRNKNESNAAKWLAASIKHGSEESKLILEEFLSPQVTEVYLKAFDNDMESQFKIGLMYDCGTTSNMGLFISKTKPPLGTVLNREAAIEWYSMAVGLHLKGSVFSSLHPLLHECQFKNSKDQYSIDWTVLPSEEIDLVFLYSSLIVNIYELKDPYVMNAYEKDIYLKSIVNLATLFDNDEEFSSLWMEEQYRSYTRDQAFLFPRSFWNRFLSVSLFQYAAKLGSGWAFKNLGVIFEQGRAPLIETNQELALYCFVNAVENGCDAAITSVKRLWLILNPLRYSREVKIYLDKMQFVETHNGRELDDDEHLKLMQYMYDLGINSFYGPKYEEILDSAGSFFLATPVKVSSEKFDVPQKKDFYSDFHSPVSLLYITAADSTSIPPFLKNSDLILTTTGGILPYDIQKHPLFFSLLTFPYESEPNYSDHKGFKAVEILSDAIRSCPYSSYSKSLSAFPVSPFRVFNACFKFGPISEEFWNIPKVIEDSLQLSLISSASLSSISNDSSFSLPSRESSSSREFKRIKSANPPETVFPSVFSPEAISSSILSSNHVFLSSPNSSSRELKSSKSTRNISENFQNRVSLTSRYPSMTRTLSVNSISLPKSKNSYSSTNLNYSMRNTNHNERYLPPKAFVQSYARAFEWFTRVCNLKAEGRHKSKTKQIISFAKYMQAAMYDNGLGVAVDFAKSFKLLLESSNLNNFIANKALGMFYQQGRGALIAPNMKEALFYYEKSFRIRFNWHAFHLFINLLPIEISKIWPHAFNGNVVDQCKVAHYYEDQIVSLHDDMERISSDTEKNDKYEPDAIMILDLAFHWYSSAIENAKSFFSIRLEEIVKRPNYSHESLSPILGLAFLQENFSIDDGGDSAYRLGWFYLRGRGSCAVDYKMAFLMWLIGSALGDSRCAFQIGNLFMRSNNSSYSNNQFPIDISLAVDWMYYSSKMGSLEATLILEQLLGTNILNILSNSNNVQSQFMLGIIYSRGPDLKKNFHPELMGVFDLGCLPENIYNYLNELITSEIKKKRSNLICPLWPTGIVQDYSRALFWYSKAAESAHAGAMNNIALLFMCMKDGDLSAAHNCLLKAAEMKLPQAIQNIGYINSSSRSTLYTNRFLEGIVCWDILKQFEIAFDTLFADPYIQAEINNKKLEEAGWKETKSEGPDAFISNLINDSKNGSLEKTFELAYTYFVGISIQPIDYEKSRALFEILSNKSLGYGTYYLSLFYLFGLGVEKNLHLSMNLMKKSEQEGFKLANFQLANIYLALSKDSTSMQSSIDNFEIASSYGLELAKDYFLKLVPPIFGRAWIDAMDNSVEACYEVAVMYESGIDGYILSDITRSLYWFARALYSSTVIDSEIYVLVKPFLGLEDKSKWLDSFTQSSKLEMSIIGMSKDITNASAHLFRVYKSEPKVSTTENFHMESLLKLAGILELKVGQLDKAIELYLIAAKFNDVSAMEKLGFFHSDRRSKLFSLDKAIEWLSRAAGLGRVSSFQRLADLITEPLATLYIQALKGESESQYQVGLRYYTGHILPLNSNLAFFFFFHAAKQNHVVAKNNVAVCFEQGKGVVLNIPQAISFFSEAAEAGNHTAMKNLGVLYEQGRTGVEINIELSVQNYYNAAIAGNLYAFQALYRLALNQSVNLNEEYFISIINSTFEESKMLFSKKFQVLRSSKPLPVSLPIDLYEKKPSYETIKKEYIAQARKSGKYKSFSIERKEYHNLVNESVSEKEPEDKTVRYFLKKNASAKLLTDKFEKRRETFNPYAEENSRLDMPIQVRSNYLKSRSSKLIASSALKDANEFLEDENGGKPLEELKSKIKFAFRQKSEEEEDAEKYGSHSEDEQVKNNMIQKPDNNKRATLKSQLKNIVTHPKKDISLNKRSTVPKNLKLNEDKKLPIKNDIQSQPLAPGTLKFKMRQSEDSDEEEMNISPKNENVTNPPSSRSVPSIQSEAAEIENAVVLSRQATIDNTIEELQLEDEPVVEVSPDEKLMQTFIDFCLVAQDYLNKFCRENKSESSSSNIIDLLDTNSIDLFANQCYSFVEELDGFKTSVYDTKFELLPYANNVLRNIGQTVDFCNSLLFTDLIVDSIEVKISTQVLLKKSIEMLIDTFSALHKRAEQASDRIKAQNEISRIHYVIFENFEQFLSLVESNRDTLNSWINDQSVETLRTNYSHPIIKQIFEVLTNICNPGFPHYIPLNMISNTKFLCEGEVTEINTSMYSSKAVILRRYPNSKSLHLHQGDVLSKLILHALERYEIAYNVSLSSPLFVKCLGGNLDCPQPFCLLEKASKGSLRDILEVDEIPGDKALDICVQLAEAVTLLHSKNILHRQLSNDHILFDDEWNVKLIGFSWFKDLAEQCASNSGYVSPLFLNSCKGVLQYKSPELLDKSHIASDRSDVYALGMLIWEIFSNEVPWYGMNGSLITQRVLEGKRPIISLKIPPPIVEIIEKCFEQNPKSRPSANEVFSHLRWVKSIRK